MTAASVLVLAAALGAATAALLAFGVYATTLYVAGSLARGRAKDRPLPATTAAGLPRIAALVVAHDEERVVRDSVSSLLAQRYPRERFEVFCVADRCTDGTETVARDAGATVLVRSAGEGGKSAAVAFGVKTALGASRFEAVAVFDADNHVDAECLARLGARLAAGERVVQGFVDAKNPEASWVAATSALGFWALAAIAQAPREALGLSAPLMGTAFAAQTADAARFLSGDGAALTDDLELGARLALEGVRVAYEPGARVLDEKPVTLRTAVSQRHRWMQGRWAVAGRYLPRLVRQAFAGGPPGVRARALDGAVQLVAPSLLFCAVALGAVALLALPVLALGGSACATGVMWPLVWSCRVAAAAALVLFVLPALAIRERRPSARLWGYYALQPLYLAFSAPLAVSGWLTRGTTRWKRTPKGR